MCVNRGRRSSSSGQSMGEEGNGDGETRRFDQTVSAYQLDPAWLVWSTRTGGVLTSLYRLLPTATLGF
ncbi:unnamed protein product [Protopolystoma xenopodis]|uniref:Uncharacterized protein n=1 Tax=Protopolystoma xenopodis TaxID=117903 RepID=A0A448WQR8_9PLAT|nr:unnamed protein product [Protopolystoma xenopodis]